MSLLFLAGADRGERRGSAAGYAVFARSPEKPLASIV
jgi:hypothetical protein